MMREWGGPAESGKMPGRDSVVNLFRKTLTHPFLAPVYPRAFHATHSGTKTVYPVAR